MTFKFIIQYFSITQETLNSSCSFWSTRFSRKWFYSVPKWVTLRYLCESNEHYEFILSCPYAISIRRFQTLKCTSNTCLLKFLIINKTRKFFNKKEKRYRLDDWNIDVILADNHHQNRPNQTPLEFVIVRDLLRIKAVKQQETICHGELSTRDRISLIQSSLSIEDLIDLVQLLLTWCFWQNRH